MPSFLHEAIVELFRARPSLAAELLGEVLGVPLPSFTAIDVREAELSQIVPTEYRADLVLLLQDGEPVFGIVVEVQLSSDEGKVWSWPLYSVALRARWRCPTCVLVVTPAAPVARWASRTIDLGPGSSMTPLVIGPNGIPWVREPTEAARRPELAVLSALAHENEPGGLDVAVAAIAAAQGLDGTRAIIYHDAVMAGLQAATRIALEELMARNQYEYQSDFARRYYGQGKAEGKAASVLRLLELRNVELTQEQRDHVLACTDLGVLDRWFARAVTAATADDVFTE